MSIKPDEILYENSFCTLSKPISVNFKVKGKPGHPYTIGPKHVSAAQSNGGYIDESVCRAVQCAHTDHYGKCDATYEEHTSDKVVFVYLRENVDAKRLQAFLIFATEGDENIDPIIPQGTDGFSFVDTGYRVLKGDS